jgi:hypothetical protein
MKFHIVHVMKMFRLFYELRETKTHIAPMGEDARTHKAVTNYCKVGGKDIRAVNFQEAPVDRK